MSKEKFFGENISEVKILFKRILAFFKRRKFLRWKQKEFPVGSIVEDCRYHPCIVRSNPKDDDLLHLVSILNLKPITCSSFLCGIRKLDPDEVEEYIYVYMQHGQSGIDEIAKRKEGENNES